MISVLMATYNGEIFIGDQLRSLADQTEPPAELVVCDDGSSDNTVEIVRAFEREAPFPVRLLVNETRRGYRANFLNGARACTEEYIAFCDQDDVWVKDKIAIVSRKLKETDATVLLHGYRLIDSEGAVISGDIDYAGLKPIAAEPAVTLRGDIHGMTQIFHRKIVDYNDLWSLSVNQWFENERMEHDEWVIFIGSLLGRIEFIDDVLNLYRQHGKNALGIQGAAEAYPVVPGLPISSGYTISAG